MRHAILIASAAALVLPAAAQAQQSAAEQRQLQRSEQNLQDMQRNVQLNEQNQRVEQLQRQVEDLDLRQRTQQNLREMEAQRGATPYVPPRLVSPAPPATPADLRVAETRRNASLDASEARLRMLGEQLKN